MKRPKSKRARQRKPAIVELVAPVVVSSGAVLLTTLVLFTIESYVATEHLLLVYLLPTILIAIYFGSTIAVLTSFASGLAAAYFLLPPQFSFYIADRLHIAELGFTLLLAVIASKVVGVLTDVHRKPEARCIDEVIE
jgi:K+-sensing histidine kinase KdpD